ncbi:MAG: hypothetical protein IKT33_02495 [Clostridia bacterium]|nr:hypothetical protein [Clostridia bacterium]
MTAWLASIVGVVVVGVIVELVMQGRRMGNFVRSIYSFMVLLVIVSPLPKILKVEWWSTKNENLVNTELVASLQQGNKQFQVTQILYAMGYKNAIVTVVDDTIYVNLGEMLSEDKLSELQTKLGQEVVIL